MKIANNSTGGKYVDIGPAYGLTKYSPYAILKIDTFGLKTILGSEDEVENVIQNNIREERFMAKITLRREGESDGEIILFPKGKYRVKLMAQEQKSGVGKDKPGKKGKP